MIRGFLKAKPIKWLPRCSNRARQFGIWQPKMKDTDSPRRKMPIFSFTLRYDLWRSFCWGRNGCGQSFIGPSTFRGRSNQIAAIWFDLPRKVEGPIKLCPQPFLPQQKLLHKSYRSVKLKIGIFLLGESVSFIFGCQIPNWRALLLQRGNHLMGFA